MRALVVGCGIGIVLAAGNVYTALKAGFIDGGNITAALLGFVIFSSVKNLARRRYGPLENNITQTTAASAAIMSFVVGLPGPVAALDMMGMVPPGWAMALWGAAAGLLGIAAAVVLRRKLIVDDALPFPTGRATAELIETIHTGREAAMRRAWLLAGTAVVAMAITWFREGSPKLIPQATAFGGTIAGVAVASLTLGMSWSPLLASTGALIGPRGGASVLLGGAIAWGVLAPRLINAGIVREAGFGAFTAWLAWPALGLLAAGSFLPLLLDPGSLRRSLRDLGALARGRAAGPPNASPAAGANRPVGSRQLGSLFLVSVVTLVLAGRIVFGISPAVTLIAVVLALVLTNVSARATGETDVAPIGPVGMLTQLAFAGAGAVGSMVTGWLSSGASAQASGTLYAFRTGERVGASTRAQVGAQLLGCLLGAVVVVPVYFLLVEELRHRNGSLTGGLRAVVEGDGRSGPRRDSGFSALRGAGGRVGHCNRRHPHARRPDAHRPLRPFAGRDRNGDARSRFVWAGDLRGCDGGDDRATRTPGPQRIRGVDSGGRWHGRRVADGRRRRRLDGRRRALKP